MRTKLNPTPIPIAVRFTALLLATLLVLALCRIEAAIAGAMAWCAPMAQPRTALSELGRHRHGVAVIDAPHAPQLSFGEKHNVPAGRPCIRDRHGGRTYEGGSFAQALSAPVSGQIRGTVAIVGDFDTLWATLGALHGRNQHPVTVFCTRV